MRVNLGTLIITRPALAQPRELIRCRLGSVRSTSSKSRSRVRDSLFGNLAEDDLAKELKLSWGEHNSTGRVGAALALREAVATCRRWRVPYLISSCIIGQEDLSAEKWHRGLKASLLGDDKMPAAIAEDSDLYDTLRTRITKPNSPHNAQLAAICTGISHLRHQGRPGTTNHNPPPWIMS